MVKHLTVNQVSGGSSPPVPVSFYMKGKQSKHEEVYKHSVTAPFSFFYV
jgi:hypothetical protein